MNNYSNRNSIFHKFFAKEIRFLFFCLLLLSGCAGEKIPTHKYWHHGTERPYVIKNVKYYPQVHYRYDKVGEASWYGYDCHGLSTASGRKFDMNKLTAAHRTLPIPSVVLVENLSNGRKVKLLVNDRGPFAYTHRRIIDVSQKAANILGFKGRGHSRVRVTCVPSESRIMALKYKRKPY
ncbi:MAG: septal ring lytic transglycosylase RlpA family protein [Holosporaceae bacterium]|jgi:rare lipoprotein A|nr:septal ring lytic transglycosylase RlpA family protein [Holosporaceae bacterium]